jgi:hypothetical protein
LRKPRMHSKGRRYLVRWNSLGAVLQAAHPLSPVSIQICLLMRRSRFHEFRFRDAAQPLPGIVVG